MKSQKATYDGFTLIELVVTIVILAIVSAFAISRFAGGSTFNAPVVRDQIVSIVRTAQQHSMGRPDVSVTITPSADGSSVTIETSDDNGAINSYVSNLRDVSLSGDINTTASCGTSAGAQSITNSTPMTINFGELGDLVVSGVTGNTGTVSSALRICVNNNPVNSVCVSPSGFAYAGDCDG